MDGHLHLLLVMGLYFVGVCIALIFGCLVWNMAVPTSYRFLDATQEATLQGFLFSGVIGSMIAAAARKVAGTTAKSTDDSHP